MQIGSTRREPFGGLGAPEGSETTPEVRSDHSGPIFTRNGTIWGETIFETGANGEQPFALQIIKYGLSWASDHAQELRAAIPYEGKQLIMQNGAMAIRFMPKTMILGFPKHVPC